MEVTYEITRYDGTKQFVQSYTIEAMPEKTILWGLEYIKEHMDPTLTFTAVCRAAVCGACAVMVNGMPRLTCEVSLQQVIEEKGPCIKIEPLRNFTVLRDLVTDWDDKVRHMKESQTWSMRNKPVAMDEQKQTKEIAGLLKQKIDCILCGSCAAVCPIVRTKGERFLEPFLFTKLARLALDDREENREQAKKRSQEKGLAYCIQCKLCTKVCPKGIDPAQDIADLRKE